LFSKNLNVLIEPERDWKLVKLIDRWIEPSLLINAKENT
jgi:hypothetical protein